MVMAAEVDEDDVRSYASMTAVDGKWRQLSRGLRVSLDTVWDNAFATYESIRTEFLQFFRHNLNFEVISPNTSSKAISF